MSESLPMLAGTVLSQEAGQMASVPGKQGGNADGATFPELFESMSFQGSDVSNPHMPSQMFPVQATGPGFVLPINPVEPGQLMSVAQLQTMQASGNIMPGGFPQIAWSGTYAVSDGDGAAVLHMQGDANQIGLSKMAYGDDMSAALRKLQIQAAARGTTTTQAVTLNQEQTMLVAQGLLARSAFGEIQNPDTAALQEGLPQLQLHTSLQSAGQTPTSIDFAGLGLVSRGNETAATQINLPVNQPQWGQAVGDRVQWMISQNLQSAEIRLNPPELGHLEIRIQLQGDQANISFTSPHGQVRDALDAALPRLREMLEQSGLTLGDVNVSQQSVAQGQSQSGDDASSNGNSRLNMAEEQLGLDDAEAQLNITKNTSISMLDVYV